MIKEIKECFPHLESLIIKRDSEILIEEYFNGQEHSLRQTSSMFKSTILSTAIGILLKQGMIASLDDPLEKIFPEESKSFECTGMKNVTLQEILTNSTGIEWPNQREESSYDWSNISMLDNLTINEKSRSKFLYKPDSHIILWIVEKVSGKRFIEFMKSEILRKLDIREIDFTWKGPQLSLMTRDIVKFGELYLNDGSWRGRQILDANYLREARRYKISGSFPENKDYGYLWWLDNVDGHDAFFAGGFGGQYLYLIPSLKMIFVVTGKTDRPRPEHRLIVKKFFEEEKIKAMEGRTRTC